MGALFLLQKILLYILKSQTYPRRMVNTVSNKYILSTQLILKHEPTFRNLKHNRQHWQSNLTVDGYKLCALFLCVT